MAWRKSSPELVARFDAALPVDPRIVRKPMFGYPAAFVNGNLFASLFEESLVLRLADAARHELLKLPGARIFEPMEGRPMREYVIAPAAIVDDQQKLHKWMGRALDFVSGLPAKKPRAKKPAAVKTKS